MNFDPVLGVRFEALPALRATMGTALVPVLRYLRTEAEFAELAREEMPPGFSDADSFSGNIDLEMHRCGELLYNQFVTPVAVRPQSNYEKQATISLFGKA